MTSGQKPIHLQTYDQKAFCVFNKGELSFQKLLFIFLQTILLQ